MATHTGNEGSLNSGNTTVGELRSWEITENVSTMDDSAIADAWDTHKVGSKSWEMSATVMWDETDTGQGTLTIGTEVTVNAYPEGTGNGATYYTGNATVTTKGHSITRNETQEMTLTLTGQGALTLTTV